MQHRWVAHGVTVAAVGLLGAAGILLSAAVASAQSPPGLANASFHSTSHGSGTATSPDPRSEATHLLPVRENGAAGPLFNGWIQIATPGQPIELLGGGTQIKSGGSDSLLGVIQFLYYVNIQNSVPLVPGVTFQTGNGIGNLLGIQTPVGTCGGPGDSGSFSVDQFQTEVQVPNVVVRPQPIASSAPPARPLRGRSVER